MQYSNKIMNSISSGKTPSPRPIKEGFNKGTEKLVRGLHHIFKVLEFLSRHTIHIKQWGTKFHMLDWCLPNQFLHPNKKMLCFYKNDSAKAIVSHLSHSHLNSFDKHKKYSQQLLD